MVIYSAESMGLIKKEHKLKVVELKAICLLLGPVGENEFRKTTSDTTVNK